MTAKQDYKRSYYEANRERIRAQHAAYREANRERIREHERHRYDGLGDDGKRARRLKATFGMTVADYDALLERQGGVCAICGQAERMNGANGSRKRLAVDHCHATGTVRGLLCAFCNTALGKFQDDPGRLRAAADYVERHQ